ncbi:MAG: mechanosensitive ion channel [Pseudomonadales bacterium]|nr:mechanosensitive ion channel [Pseudomonadales bacterium]
MLDQEISHAQKYIDQFISLAVEYSPKLMMAVLTLLIGFWLIKRVVKLLEASLKLQKVDVSLATFLTHLIEILFKVLLIVSVASMVGIETTSFVAIFGAAGLAIGLALQGSLGNFAGGVLILFFKPYKVGDLIKAEGHLGVVKEIQIFTTVLVDPNNKRIIVPNGPLSNNSIVNYSAEGTLRVDLSVGIAYDADIKLAKERLLALLTADPRVLSEPAPMVGVSELADSSVNLAIRPWCKVEDYWDVFFDMNEAIKTTLDEAKVVIPFPQRDVHVFNHQS